MQIPTPVIGTVLAVGLNLCMIGLSTSPASAGCQEEFEDLNAAQTRAGAYEITGDVVIEDRKADRVRKSRVVTQFDSHGSVRMTGVNLLTQPDFVIVGEAGWIDDKGQWVPMAAADVAASRARLTESGFFYADNASDFECLGLQSFDDKTYLTFRFVQNTQSYKTQITAYFDPVSRLPVAGQTALETGRLISTSMMRYRFDPTIHIEAPK